MGAPWVGSLSLLGLKGPLGLLDPRASLDPREPRGKGSWGGFPPYLFKGFPPYLFKWTTPTPPDKRNETDLNEPTLFKR